MKMIHTHFYANMRMITGIANLDVPLSSARTLGELLNKLVELFPVMRFNVFDEHGDLRQDVPIFVNGRNPRLNKVGINLPLAADDVISFFSPISSGRMNVEVMRSPEPDERE